jgi:hypothetical protein
MQFYNVTCDNSKHIVSAQKWLFNKYLSCEPVYLDVKGTPLNDWGSTVANMLPNDEYIIFGLDDFLPIDYINTSKLDEALRIVKKNDLDRFELGWGASRKKGFIPQAGWLKYGEQTPYKVSCQFSIWKTSTLKRELTRTTTPWKFETHGFADAGCFNDAVFRWIEESAISGRRQGKINLCGLSLEDENELINLGLIDKNKVIYAWKGNENRTEEVYGKKYKEYY